VCEINLADSPKIRIAFDLDIDYGEQHQYGPARNRVGRFLPEGMMHLICSILQHEILKF
jgi:hypothetical protein